MPSISVLWVQTHRTKLTGNKPRQALGDGLCLYESFSSHLACQTGFLIEENNGFICFLLVRLFPPSFSLNFLHNHTTPPLSFSYSFPPLLALSFLPSLTPSVSPPTLLVPLFITPPALAFSLWESETEMKWLYWPVDISKVDKCPAEITWNHSAFLPHGTVFIHCNTFATAQPLYNSTPDVFFMYHMR